MAERQNQRRNSNGHGGANGGRRKHSKSHDARGENKDKNLPNDGVNNNGKISESNRHERPNRGRCKQVRGNNLPCDNHSEVKDDGHGSSKSQPGHGYCSRKDETLGRGRGRGFARDSGRVSRQSLSTGLPMDERSRKHCPRDRSLQNTQCTSRGHRDKSSSVQGFHASRKSEQNMQRHNSKERNKRGPEQSQPRPIWPMRRVKLQDILKQDPSDVILSLVEPRSGFPEMLSLPSLEWDMINLTLKVLEKALTTHLHPENKNRIIVNVLTSDFLAKYIPQMTGEIIQDANSSNVLNCISTICQVFLTCMPDRAVEKLKICIPLCQTIAGTIAASGKDICKEVEDSFRNLQMQIQNFQLIVKDKQQTLKQQQMKEKVSHFANFGGDDEFGDETFRNIPIMPTADELRSHVPPYLPENIIHGQYKNVQQYLNVHFRLLREDFICPLRDGITEYIHQTKQGGNRKTRYKDVQVYHGVQIHSEVVKHEGVFYQLNLDLSHLRKVKCEISRRLIFGSLLCLSNDNFDTMLFATVVDRNPEDIKKGILVVKFGVEDEDLETLQNVKTKGKKTNFVMVESQAYFEAYRHVLRGLQCIDSLTMPLQQYILGVQKVPKLPDYLQPTSSYHLSVKPVVGKRKLEEFKSELPKRKLARLEAWRPTQELEEFEIESKEEFEIESKEEFEIESKEELETESNGRPERLEDDIDTHYEFVVPVLDLLQWPSHEELDLDESQRRAMHLALTNELAIIQGPPGTGKTYVGLKIVKTLLSNRHVWRHHDDCNSPILVVCYTNHALDQFLEGMISFTHKLIRVGSRSSTIALANFNLRRIRDNMRSKRLRAPNIHYNLESQSIELVQKKMRIEAIHSQLAKLETHIIHESGFKDLQGVDIRLIHSLELGFAPYFGVRLDQMSRPPSLLTAWLGLLLGGVGLYVSENELECFLTDEPDVPNPAIPLQAPGNQNMVADEVEEQRLIDVVDERDAETANRLLDTVETDYAFTLTEDMPQFNYKEMALAVADLPYPNTQLPPNVQVPHEWYGYLKGIGIMQKDIATRELKKWNELDDKEVAGITNVWNVSLPDRWCLYRRWIGQYRSLVNAKLDQLKLEYAITVKRFREVKDGEDLSILKDSDIIGMTTSGAAQYQHLLQALNPKIVIVEEAAEVLEAHLVATLAPNTQHLILIGDHQQLRPKPTTYHLAKRYHLEISMFERFIKNGVRYETLTLQHRMRPEISNLLVPNIYKVLDDHPDVRRYPAICNVSQSVFFLSHSEAEAQVAESKTHANEFEAKYLVGLCRYLLQQGYSPKQITILTTYTGQLYTLRSLMPLDIFDGVRVTVVDNFQGEENDIILLSLVRSNDEGNIGFLKIENRVCVALSRARHGLFCVGNFRQLADGSDLWRRIFATLERNGQIGPKLRLVCPQHLDVLSEVSCGPDFVKVSPEGGCIRMCNYILPCGHQCPRVCHRSDHEGAKCAQSCKNVICERGHACPRPCYQPCTHCEVMVEKILSNCGHKKMLPCFRDEKSVNCLTRVGRVLPCGHSKDLFCHTDITTYKCSKLVERILPACKHTITLACHKDLETSLCSENCEFRLDCGHVCGLKCHPFENPDHENITCQKRCQRVICDLGHKCEKLCWQKCSMCQVYVSKILACGHEYEVPCGEDIEILAKLCQLPTTKLLPCGHSSKIPCNENVITYSRVNSCKIMEKKSIPDCGHEVEAECRIDTSELICFTLFEKSMTCGHTVKIPCYARKKIENFQQKFCQHPCNKVLPCGHSCTGTCDQCRQGRLHISCQKDCGRVQICGHSCQIPCAAVCPPCRKRCATRCQHSRCPKKCGQPCKPCTELLCTWRCNHYTCTKLCSEDCDRPPCNKPCQWKLRCGHPCVGLCGERCPKLCRICDYDKLTEFIFYGFEEEADARFVQLEDCGHCIEVQALDKWMEMGQEEIQMKVCPRCQSTIWRSRRYGNRIRECMLDVRRVKKHLFGSHKELVATIARLKQLIRRERSSLHNFQDPVLKLEKRLSTSFVNQIEATLIENQINILLVMANVLDQAKYFEVRAQKFVTVDIKFLCGRLLDFQEKISEQQLEQLNREIRRTSMLGRVMHILQRLKIGNNLTTELREQLESVSNSLSCAHELGDDEEKANWDILKRLDSVSGHGVSEQERNMIVKTLRLGTGHWYKCPNGHVYAIGNCGAPNQIGRCNECGASIGGTGAMLENNNTRDSLLEMSWR